MEALNNYIVERIRIDKIKPRFPIDGPLNDMIEFLKMNGFEETTIKHGTTVEKLNNAHTKCYYYEERENESGGFVMYFADTSKYKINKSNPGYFISIIGTKKSLNMYEEIYGNTGTFVDRLVFQTMMEKLFG